MNQIPVDLLLVVELLTINQPVSVYLTMKEILHVSPADYQIILVIPHLVDLTHSVQFCQMDFRNVLAYKDLLKVRIQFVAVLKQEILVNLILAV